jgi:hypothetical protein
MNSINLCKKDNRFTLQFAMLAFLSLGFIVLFVLNFLQLIRCKDQLFYKACYAGLS